MVLVHGVHGAASDFRYLCRLFARMEGMAVLALKANEQSKLLYEGLAASGERAVAETRAFLRANEDVRRLSLVGHSFGGLIIRYMAGVLYEREACALEPVNFITIATPHLGIRRPQARPLLSGGLVNAAFKAVSENMCSRMGRELNLIDHPDEPVLVQLSEGPYLAALHRFQRLKLYANIFNDLLVPYCTASIQSRNPYRMSKGPPAMSPRYPHITLRSLYASAFTGRCAPIPEERPPRVYDHGRWLPSVVVDQGALLERLSGSAGKLDAALEDAAQTAAMGQRVPTPPRGGAPPASQAAFAPAADERKREKGKGITAMGTRRLNLWESDLEHANEETAFAGDTQAGHFLRTMASRLNGLRWQRLDCYFPSAAAHEEIVNKNDWTAHLGLDNGDVCRHIADTFHGWHA